MKKNILMAALIAVLAFGLFSCNKDEASKKDLLTKEGGWQLAEGTITPAFEMNDGSMVSDIMDYLYTCEKDDEILFNADGSEIISTKVTCAEGEGIQGDKVAALWKFDNDEEPTTLYCQLPFIYDYDNEGNVTGYSEIQENCKIVDLTKDELVISYTVNITKGDQYTFKMTFKDPKKVAKK